MAVHIEWTFAKNDGGRETGFHDAGVETFKGNFDRYLAREIIQNSLDARDDPDKPVRVRFQLRSIERSQIPDLDGLSKALHRAALYWKQDKKAFKFFGNAEKIAKQKQLPALQVSDYNTTGVPGGDTDRDKNWYNLIRCAGSSPKGGGEGGSFGIGKNAPFAASQLRTVLYSTKVSAGDEAFQGVAVLASHEHPDGGTAQPIGFLGGKKGASIRFESAIPQTFRRTQKGTDLVILGFPESPNWDEDLIHSVLDNFWPAIHWGQLEVQIGTKHIKKPDLSKLLEQFSIKEDFTAHLYFQALTEPTVPAIESYLSTLGKCELYLRAGAAESMPKLIAMIRMSGMKVWEKQFRSIVPFCGVFLCRNAKGNAVLRDMEPPGHDKWDPDLPEKGAHKDAYSELIAFIRSSIKQLSPADETKTMLVPELHKYLPDDEDTPEEAFDDQNTEKEKKETFKRETVPGKIEGHKMRLKKEMQQDQSDLGDGTEETATGSSGGKGSGGDSTGTGDYIPKGGDEVGGKSGKPAVPLVSRTFSLDSSAGVYRIVVATATPNSKPLKVQVWTVGEDQKVPAEIKTARIAGGANLPVESGGVLGPLKLSNKNPIKLEVTLREPLLVAMEVTGHEAQP